MNEDDDEEDGVKVRDGRGCADDETPCETHSPVSDIVLQTRKRYQINMRSIKVQNMWRVSYRLARVPPPAVNQKTVPTG